VAHLDSSVPLRRSRKGSEESFPNSKSGHYDEALAFGAIRMFSIARTSFFAMQKDFQNDMPADITAE
jgi:hypothetical protein